MFYELFIEHHAEKDLRKLADSHLFSEITAKIIELKDNPHPQGSKKIKGTHNDWRLRIGDYRVLYEINKIS
jgi:mRNA interferase RelE/StbE